MLSLVLVVLAQTSAPEDWIRPPRLERVQRAGGRGGPGLAWFEFAPASGAGMGAVCACTTPTGARGEAMTFSRASTATCTKTATGGLATSGIANGDLVTCSTNQPRVEYDSAGVLGLLVESARTNVLLRSDALTNAAWADVGTPNATDGATDPFGGTTGDTLTDDAAGAFEGRSQAVTVTAATAYIMSCYLKGTTSAKARLSLDGTTCDTSTLSSTTWSLVTCADASSSGVSISAQVLVGNAVGDTGDVVVGGCQVEAGSYATSYMATGAASVNRTGEIASFSVPLSATTFSIAISSLRPASTMPNADAIFLTNTTFVEMALPTPTSYVHKWSGGSVGAVAAIAPGLNRLAASYDGTTRLACVDGACTSSAGVLTVPSSPWVVYLGSYSSGFQSDAINSRVCVDSSPTRCR